MPALRKRQQCHDSNRNEKRRLEASATKNMPG
jgi:hypothetical protein